MGVPSYRLSAEQQQHESNTPKTRKVEDIFAEGKTELADFYIVDTIHAGCYFPSAPDELPVSYPNHCVSGISIGPDGNPYGFALVGGEYTRYLYGLRELWLTQNVRYLKMSERLASDVWNSLYGGKPWGNKIPSTPQYDMAMRVYGLADVLHFSDPDCPLSGTNAGRHWSFGDPEIPPNFRVVSIMTKREFEVPRVWFEGTGNWCLAWDRDKSGGLGRKLIVDKDGLIQHWTERRYRIIDTIHFQVGKPPEITYYDEERLYARGTDKTDDAAGHWRDARQSGVDEGGAGGGEDQGGADGEHGSGPAGEGA